MSETTRILIIEDQPTDAELVQREVRRTLPNSEFMCVDTEKDFLAALESFRPEIILSDYTLPKFSGMAALKLAKEHIPDIPFILVTGSINEESAVDCMKAGASDYILKDRISRIGSGILNSMEQKRMRDEARNSADELRESESRYRIIFENSQDALINGDPISGEMTSMNPAAIKMFRAQDEQDLIRCPPWKLSPEFQPDGQRSEETSREMMAKAVREGSNVFEWQLKRLDDEEFPASIMITRYTINEKVMIQSTIRDITEQKKAEAERERLALAIEQAAETVVITDTKGVILYANPIFEQTTGYSCKEALGQNPRILKSDQQDDAFYRDMWQTLSSGEIWRGNFVNKRKDGSLYTEEATISPVLDATGNIINYVAVKRDVTERLELKNQLQQAQKMESIGQLAGGVAHDFNNKLQVILSYAEMALSTVAPESKMYGDLNEISTAAKQSADLTRQLLTFARKQNISPKILDLNASIENMLKMLRRLIGEDTDLLWHPASDLWPVNMDPTQVDQILANLCVNARDAIDGVGSITIKTQNASLDDTHCKGNADALPGDYLMLSIRDNGCGMDKELLEHIYEPFFTSKAPGQGTGLGLATIYGIVKQNSGIITVDSTPGTGTTFNIYLPRCMDEIDQTPKDRPKKPPIQGRETILLVEDETTLLNLVLRMLETLGYTVLAANLPSTALRLAKEYPGNIDALVTDVIMPEANGPELAAQLKSLRPNLKCLFMSGYTADAMGPDNILSEKVHFIQKPFEIEDIAAKLRAVLVDD